jgi:hypothetical protein
VGGLGQGCMHVLWSYATSSVEPWQGLCVWVWWAISFCLGWSLEATQGAVTQ